VANAIFFASAVGWIWVTRDRNLANLDPKLELKRYFYWMGWLVCYIWGVYYAGSYTLEQDAAWHQVIIRDTSFTASHIVAFYGTFPLYITCGVSSYLYAQTRLPLYNQATSFPLVAAVVGPMFILPNVGLNEWGHAFWFVDELFSAPLHWGFVTLGWCGLFGAGGGVAAQIVSPHVEPGGRDLEQCAQEHSGSVPQPGGHGTKDRLLSGTEWPLRLTGPVDLVRVERAEGLCHDGAAPLTFCGACMGKGMSERQDGAGWCPQRDLNPCYCLERAMS
jgi:methane monooxygenase/ammonia monooxygenase subunit C